MGNKGYMVFVFFDIRFYYLRFVLVNVYYLYEDKFYFKIDSKI